MPTRRTVGRSAVAAAVAVASLLVLTPGSAGAADRGDDDSRITITGSVSVGASEHVDGLVATADGSIRVAGVVDGDVVALHGDVIVTATGRVTGTITVVDGDARISGHVGDHVLALRGRAVIESGAVVRGDVRSSERPDVAPGADVRGDIEKTNFSAWFTAAGWIALFVWWLAVTVTLLIVGILLALILPGAARAVTAVGRREPGISVLWGLLLGIVLPIAAGLLAATFVGLPLAFGIMLGLVLAFPLGYVVSAMVLGRLIARDSSILVAFLIGFAILRVVALIPGLGLLIGFLAAGYGLGALGVAAWRAGRRPEPRPDEGPAVADTPVEAAG
jgi:cytoskeletal protein CcmA (bactofilin family)